MQGNMINVQDTCPENTFSNGIQEWGKSPNKRTVSVFRLHCIASNTIIHICTCILVAIHSPEDTLAKHCTLMTGREKLHLCWSAETGESLFPSSHHLFPWKTHPDWSGSCTACRHTHLQCFQHFALFSSQDTGAVLGFLLLVGQKIIWASSLSSVPYESDVVKTFLPSQEYSLRLSDSPVGQADFTSHLHDRQMWLKIFTANCLTIDWTNSLQYSYKIASCK